MAVGMANFNQQAAAEQQRLNEFQAAGCRFRCRQLYYQPF